jgi:catechol 2,3-dioxygenase-like lactoylglutathione lyase family enzyme
MQLQLTHVNVWVHDQDEALAFYTEKLGMELRDDVTVAELGNFRWLTVGPPSQPDVAFTLMTVPPVFEEDTQSMLKDLMGRGVLGGLFFAVEDINSAYEELKGKGVEFTQEPTQQPYGVDAGFRDPSGNQFRMAQLAPDAA